jgi:AcrR family transcriptional regulator
MLDAAAAVIVESGGVEGASMQAIAERARTSVASIYQFFPNRDGVVRALAARYLGELRRVYEGVLSFDAVALPVEELVARIVEPLAAFHARTPAYPYVYHATSGPGAAAGPEGEFKEAVVRLAASLIAARAPHVAPARAAVHAALVLETMHAVLRTSVGLPRAGRAALVAELARMLRLYAADVEAPPPRERGA